MRLAAVATALLLVGCGADDGDTAAAGPTSTAPPATSAPAPTTAADVPRVLIAGDSVMEEAAGALTYAIEATGAAHAAFALGPDLPRDAADVAVWQAALDEHRPDLVVVSVGHWEYLEVLGDFAEGDLLEPGTYASEILDPFADLVTADGARLLWVGPLVIEDAEEAEFVDGLQRDFEALAERRDDVDFVDADTWVAPDGFRATLPGPDGQPVPVRRADGIHLCPEGQVLLAEGLLSVSRRRARADAVTDLGRRVAGGAAARTGRLCARLPGRLIAVRRRGPRGPRGARRPGAGPAGARPGPPAGDRSGAASACVRTRAGG